MRITPLPVPMAIVPELAVGEMAEVKTGVDFEGRRRTWMPVSRKVELIWGAGRSLVRWIEGVDVVPRKVDLSARRCLE